MTFEIPEMLVEAITERPGEVEVHGPYIAVAGGIVGHTDPYHPTFSAFVTIRNDGCRVWQRGRGYKGVPKPGERFMLNIHQQHGVIAKRAEDVIVLLCADAETPFDAWANLIRAERELERPSQFTPKEKP